MRNKIIACIGCFILAAGIVAGCSTQKTWFEVHGLKFSESNDVTLVTKTYKDGEDMGEAELSVNVTVSETMMDNGLKEVTAFYKYDTSKVAEGASPSLWQSAFDMYTGTSFEFDPNSAKKNELYSGGVEFGFNGKKINVKMEYAVVSDINGKPITKISVTCPQDYDGVVFQLGYCDKEIIATNSAIDYSARTYTIDELPGFDGNGKTYYYFRLG